MTSKQIDIANGVAIYNNQTITIVLPKMKKLLISKNDSKAYFDRDNYVYY